MPALSTLPPNFGKAETAGDMPVNLNKVLKEIEAALGSSSSISVTNVTDLAALATTSLSLGTIAWANAASSHFVLVQSSTAANHTTVEATFDNTSWRWVILPLADGIGTFGSDTILNLPNSATTPTKALELITSFRVNTAGSEESQFQVFLRQTGAATEGGGFKFNTGALPFLYVGALANNNGLRQTSATSMDINAGGVAGIGLSSTTGVSLLQATVCNSRLNYNAAGSIAIATTITWGVGNVQPVTAGTGTLNSINMSANGWTSGMRGTLVCPTGVTITNGVGGTGATILTPAGTSIVTSSKRAIPFTYDGTNMIVEG